MAFRVMWMPIYIRIYVMWAAYFVWAPKLCAWVPYVVWAPYVPTLCRHIYVVWAPTLCGRLRCVDAYVVWTPTLCGRLCCVHAYVVRTPTLCGRLRCVDAYVVWAHMRCVDAYVVWTPTLCGHIRIVSYKILTNHRRWTVYRDWCCMVTFAVAVEQTMRMGRHCTRMRSRIRQRIFKVGAVRVDKYTAVIILGQRRRARVKRSTSFISSYDLHDSHPIVINPQHLMNYNHCIQLLYTLLYIARL